MQQRKREYQSLAEKTKASFNQKFWDSTRECLFDVLQDGDRGDSKTRPNQLIALALPFPVLDESNQRKWRGVLRTIEAELLTPVGLRSLSPFDKQVPGPVYRRGQRARRGLPPGDCVALALRFLRYRLSAGLSAGTQDTRFHAGAVLAFPEEDDGSGDRHPFRNLRRRSAEPSERMHFPSMDGRRNPAVVFAGRGRDPHRSLKHHYRFL